MGLEEIQKLFLLHEKKLEELLNSEKKNLKNNTIIINNIEDENNYIYNNLK